MHEQTNKTPAAGDEFAAIAENAFADRSELLEEPQPYDGPWEELPLERGADARFESPPARDGDAEFDADLVALRERFVPFMRRLAPAPPFCRKRIELKTFDWRLEAEADQREARRPFEGAGEWEQVEVPHYGGPLGRATTYYRCEFEADDAFFEPGAAFLRFGAVDYVAHVFLNDRFLGSHEGFFAAFEFDVTDTLRSGRNSIVVRVENDAPFQGLNSWVPGDFHGDKIYAATGLGYDDPQRGWHHCPPGMGICRPVFLEARAPRHLHDVFVRPLREEGRLAITFEVWNTETKAAPVDLRFSIFGRNHEATVCEDASPGDEREPAEPKRNDYTVIVDAPDLCDWEPDAPWLYELHARLLDDEGRTVDGLVRHFGVRSFAFDETSTPKGRPVFNGREIRLRGANTMGHEQQCVLRGDLDQLRDDVLIAKAANLNFLRLTQRPVEPEVYEYCDMLGMMTQTDLPLFGVICRPKVVEVIRQAAEMERHIRNSPANIAVSYINEPFPCPRKPQREITREEMESLFRVLDRVVRLENPDRAIKHVDGDYNPPSTTLPDNHCYNMWYNGHALPLGKLHRGHWVKVLKDWMYACGEYGVEALEDVELMRERYPAGWLPQTPEEEAAWDPADIVKAQTGRFHYHWYETPRSLEGWVAASQEHQRWGVRLMTEAFRRDRRHVSYALHLLIDAFPAGWMKAVVDCRRRPKPAFFAFRDASAPLLLSLRTNHARLFCGSAAVAEVWICHDGPDARDDVRLHYQLRRADGRIEGSGEALARIPAVDSLPFGMIRVPGIETAERETAVLEAALADPDGNILASATQPFELFPETPPQLDRPVGVVGASDGPAACLAKRLGTRAAFGENAFAESTLLVDGNAFESQRDALGKAVATGARCVVLSLPEGCHTVAGERVEAVTTAMNPRVFASRDTGHPAVAALRPDDCKFWWDEDAGWATPFVATVLLTGDNWSPILTAGTGEARLGTTVVPRWQPYPVAAERRNADGGTWIVCQAELHNRVRHNPAAANFALGLLGVQAG